MTHELLDLDAARQHFRLEFASIDGSPVRDAIETLTRHLADQIAARPGRDIAAAGDVLVEASSCLGGFFFSHPGLHPSTYINILAATGVELDQRATDLNAVSWPPQSLDTHEGALRLMADVANEAEVDARRYRLAWQSARRRAAR